MLDTKSDLESLNLRIAEKGAELKKLRAMTKQVSDTLKGLEMEREKLLDGNQMKMFEDVERMKSLMGL